MEENKSENLDKEISEEEKYHSSINMLIAWNSGCITNRYINPEAEREMRIRAYRQLSQENPKQSFYLRINLYIFILSCLDGKIKRILAT